MMNRLENAARQALARLQAHTGAADLDAIAALNEALAEQQAAEPSKQCATPEQCKNTFCAPPCPGCKTAPTQQAAESNAVLVEGFGRVAMRKLNDLIAKGYAINGVAITTPTPDGKTEHGQVTTHGKVLWWHQQPAQQAAEPVAQKPYAYEYGVDNGDGTYSIQIDRGSLIHTGVQYEYCAPRNPHPEHPVKPLYTHPAPTQQPLTDDELRNVLRNTNHMIRNAMHGSFWPELEQACRAIEAAHGITSKKGGAA